MSEPVNRRPYNASKRRAAADRTRHDIVRAAHGLFTTQGYAETMVAEIAQRAGVSVDTVYASVGRKPHLLLAAHDLALAEGSSAQEATDRDYVRLVRRAPTGRLKIATYAEALGRVLPQSVPLLLALRDAGATDTECAAVFELVGRRRADNMRLFAADLRATGDLRGDLTDQWVAQLVWSMNGPEYFDLLQRQGVSAAAYVELITDVWTRSLLRPT